jgi:hypothetical protein
MISKVEIEATAIKQENTSIKTILTRSNISTDTLPPTNFQPSEQNTSPSDLTTFQPSAQATQDANLDFQPPQQNASPSDFTTFQSPEQDPSPTNLDFQSLQHSNWPSNSSSSSNVTIAFDQFIDANSLQISPHGSFDNTTLLNSPDIFNFPANTLSQSPPTTIEASHGLQKPLPQLPGEKAPVSAAPLQPDISSIAINFILA